MKNMKQRTSKLCSERVLGKYLDMPIGLAKKVNKQLIRRHRRIMEKKEVRREIADSFASYIPPKRVCSYCYETEPIKGLSICKDCLAIQQENEGLDFLFEKADGFERIIPISSDISVQLAK